MKNFSHSSGWYTLIEILAGVLIVSIVTVSWLYGMNAIWVWKVKLMEKTQLEQQAFYFSERFFELVKESWTIDYEEYFNRQNVWNSTYLSGHYDTLTGFGNGTTAMIYCTSKSWTKISTGSGCISDFNVLWSSLTWAVIDQDYTWAPLLYGQYREQFIDYNSDFDSDQWDEDGVDNEIVWDDDDAFLWNGPYAFSSTWSISEIYLINKDETERTFFRWFVSEDPDKPATATCDFSSPETPVGTGCLWTIQFLKLKWVDWWNDHDLVSIDATQNDGIVDTWVYDASTYWLPSDIVADFGTNNSEDYWLTIFSDGINVQNIEMYGYPSKETTLAWWEDSSVFVSPYLRISMTLLPSWKKKRKIQWKIPEVQINTTINLTTDYH